MTSKVKNTFYQAESLPQGRWYMFRHSLRWVSDLPGHTLLILTSILMLVPLLYIISVSFQTMEQILQGGGNLPIPPTLEAYRYVLEKMNFSLYFRNTLVVVTLNLVGAFISNTLGAYGFARFRFPGREQIFALLLASLMLPFVVRLVPTYIMFYKLGWINSFLPLIVPSFFGSAFYVFLLRQFFTQLPNELFDAARIDGCDEVSILVRIVLPLSKPALATMFIFVAQNSWNDFMGPLLYLQRPQLRTLALALYAFRSAPQGIPTWNNLMAIVVLMTIPILILFALFQRYFIQGITMSGIKG